MAEQTFSFMKKRQGSCLSTNRCSGGIRCTDSRALSFKQAAQPMASVSSSIIQRQVRMAASLRSGIQPPGIARIPPHRRVIRARK